MRIEECFAINKDVNKPCMVLKVTYAMIHKQNYCNKCRFYKTKEDYLKNAGKVESLGG